MYNKTNWNKPLDSMDAYQSSWDWTVAHSEYHFDKHIADKPGEWYDIIGRFEGNELIVETDNFTEGVLLSHVGEGSGGIVHSDALKLIERYRVDADGNLAFSWEATDSNYFSGPIRGGVVLSPTALDLDEYNCEKAIQD